MFTAYPEVALAPSLSPMLHSAGILPFRRRGGALEVLIAHFGGPFWARRDAGAWSVIKGELDQEEEPLAAAKREFAEETGWVAPEAGYLSLGTAPGRSGKIVEVWAVETDFEPGALRPGTFTLEWPPLSGRMAEFPEIDRVAWFDPAEARRRLVKGQVIFIQKLLGTVGNETSSGEVGRVDQQDGRTRRE